MNPQDYASFYNYSLSLSLCIHGCFFLPASNLFSTFFQLVLWVLTVLLGHWIQLLAFATRKMNFHFQQFIYHLISFINISQHLNFISFFLKTYQVLLPSNSRTEPWMRHCRFLGWYRYNQWCLLPSRALLSKHNPKTQLQQWVLSFSYMPSSTIYCDMLFCS